MRLLCCRQPDPVLVPELPPEVVAHPEQEVAVLAPRRTRGRAALLGPRPPGDPRPGDGHHGGALPPALRQQLPHPQRDHLQRPHRLGHRHRDHGDRQSCSDPIDISLFLAYFFPFLPIYFFVLAFIHQEPMVSFMQKCRISPRI